MSADARPATTEPWRDLLVRTERGAATPSNYSKLMIALEEAGKWGMALETFALMAKNGLAPSQADFESGIRACCAGAVGHGQPRRYLRLIHEMREEHQMAPSAACYSLVLARLEDESAVSAMISVYRKAVSDHSYFFVELNETTVDVRRVPAAVARASLVSLLYSLCAGERPTPSADLHVRCHLSDLSDEATATGEGAGEGGTQATNIIDLCKTFTPSHQPPSQWGPMRP